jgi:hypothetical protein
LVPEKILIRRCAWSTARVINLPGEARLGNIAETVRRRVGHNGVEQRIGIQHRDINRVSRREGGQRGNRAAPLTKVVSKAAETSEVRHRENQKIFGTDACQRTDGCIDIRGNSADVRAILAGIAFASMSLRSLDPSQIGIERVGVRCGDRCEVAVGSFFESAPVGYTYVPRFIIHDWDAQQSAAILRRCRSAMAANGRFLLV